MISSIIIMTILHEYTHRHHMLPSSIPSSAPCTYRPVPVVIIQLLLFPRNDPIIQQRAAIVVVQLHSLFDLDTGI